ncbi:type I-U CRISPR-associated helicase/endonuclease Cas3 [Microbispora hainanensis]|uniref:type I-G CRISPR-associated helicase/endonuclease Cas3g n=1 Tax=Microbispora TaxID=2005 RepID=UPI001158DFB4|nr:MULTISPECIES: type I-U CRISPR-associated helicase/endonuclease Cas3 [Microbispora]NJP29988.1 type I-U CRISPR-associated helicase/endonuclease Cas3 [Microbispora sp. CL1-1]TQS03496.1 type I-U CRISPR-associated helicase/endonuclease Cas3 [Microbispora sp. SCL1-1]
MTLSISDFDDFFSAVNSGDGIPHDGIRPFGWQRRLLEGLVEDGRWPDVIGAPTGAGKTSVIDIHVFSVALMAAGAAPRLPRRLSMVVDRRVLVDDQYQHACGVRDKLGNPSSEILAEVAHLLRSLRITADAVSPLMVTRLRGGMPAPRAWRDDATACQIICATPDMWGSRLLFSGYGSSSSSRPREAGLLAFDSAVVVDEAHLSRQLIRTARRVAELAAISDRPLPVPVLQVVEATATPDEPGAMVMVDVDEADLTESPTLEERLRTPKPVEFLKLPTWPIPAKGTPRTAALASMVECATRLRDTYGPTIGCFVNNVATATDLAALLGKRGVTRLVCGRLRPYDLDRLRDTNPGLLSADGNPAVDFLISTQSLEVGVDLDWAAALIEPASGSAIAQRAGRVNRRGKRADTRIVMVVPEKDVGDKANTAPYQPEDVNAALTWLHGRQADPRGLAPWALREDPPPSQRRHRTLLQRAELGDAWMWARTSDQLFATADLDLWLSDNLAEDLDVGVVVRQGLPTDPVAAIELLRALPPFDYEAIPVRINTCRKRIDDISTPVFLVRDDEVSIYSTGDLRPGDIVVVDASSSIFTVIDGMPVVDQTGSCAAADVLEGPADPETGQFVFRLGHGPFLDPATCNDDETRTAIAHVLTVATTLMSTDGLDSRRARTDLADALDKLTPVLAEPVADKVRAAIQVLRKARLKDFEVHLLGEPPATLLITDNRRMVHDETARQQWTPRQRVPLQAHAAAVAERARITSDQLGLESLSTLLELAGLHHDDGKADPRFQFSLDPQRTSEQPLAKSDMSTLRQITQARAQSGLPAGWRHEQLSVLACWSALAHLPTGDRDLVARLVGTSHGQGRHGFPHTATELTGDDTYRELARLLYDEGEWDHLIERTHSTFGVWGCAYLEALLRAADGQVSSEGS